MRKRILFLFLMIALTAAVLPAFAQEELIYSNFNSDPVISHPDHYTVLNIKDGQDRSMALIQRIRTHHWNNGNGSTPGIITVFEDDNKIGEWQAVGRSAYGVQNVYWEALVDFMLYPDHSYFVAVSDVNSLSYNEASDGCGMFELYGLRPGAEGYYIPTSGSTTTTATSSSSQTSGSIALPSSFWTGQTFMMGQYEQDNNLNNGKEPIEWQVLDVQKDMVLVVSRYGLDAREYFETLSDVTWETSSIRRWLNDTFYNTAFSAAEKARIILVNKNNPNNPEYGTRGGNKTQDRIFLLSIDEAQRYFVTKSDRLCFASEYARSYGIFVDETNGGSSWWWLRSPGMESNMAAFVSNDGSIGTYGYGVYNQYGVIRPAFWLRAASAPTPTPQPQNCFRVTYKGNNCLAQVPTDNKCYRMGDMVTILFEPVEYMGGLIFNGWDMNSDGTADFGYSYPTFVMPGHDVVLNAICYQPYRDQYNDYDQRQNSITDQQQYYNPYDDPRLNNDVYDPGTGWWYDPGYYDGVG